MKKWYALLGLFVVVLYLARSGAFSRRPDIGPLKPGNTVDVHIARGALVIEGDPVDPLVDVKLFRKGASRTEIMLGSPFSTPALALFFFEPEIGATYEAQITTKHRKEAFALEAKKDPRPVEIARFSLNDGPTGVEFRSEDEIAVQCDGIRRVFSLSSGTQTGSSLESAPPLTATKAISGSGHFIAFIDPLPGKLTQSWQVVVFH